MMTAKIRWIDKIPSQENPQNSQVDIIWSGSESEDDIEIPQKVPKCTRSKSMWIKPVIIPEVDSFSERQYSQESPIFSSLRLEDTSPILTNTNESKEALNTSPVIGKCKALKRVRSRCGRMPTIKKKVFDEGNTSPDLFLSPTTQLIQSDSPDRNEASFLHIVSFPSQDSSKVANYGTDSSFRTNSASSLYHEPARRRKRFKKGGLAFQLQKTLELQRTRNSIWEHETFIKKDHSSADLFTEDILYFSVTKSWKEYGSLLTECCKCDCDGEFISNNRNRTFVIILGSNVNMSIEVGLKYELHPPYGIDRIDYGQSNIPCYFNVTRFKLHKC